MDTYGETEPVSFIVRWYSGSIWSSIHESEVSSAEHRFDSCSDYNWDRDTQQIWHRFLNKDVADASNGFTEGVVGKKGVYQLTS